MKYLLNLRKVINAHDKVSLGRLTQARIAELYGITGACVSMSQTLPFGKTKLEKFKRLHEKYFKDYIDFEQTYQEINDIKRQKTKRIC